MPDSNAPVEEQSLLNEPLDTKPVDTSPEGKLYPENKPADAKPAEPAKTDEPAAKPTDLKPGEPTPEPKKEEPKEPSKPSPEPNATVDYENLKLPEGSPLPVEQLAQIKKEAKEQSLTLEQAQSLIQSKNEAAKSVLANQYETLKNAREGWKEAWKTDPEFGGDKFKENTELAKRAWDKFADSELKTLANQTGWGDHPAVLRLMARVGRLFSEDQLIRGNTGGVPRDIPPEERMYGKTTPGAE